MLPGGLPMTWYVALLRVAMCILFADEPLLALHAASPYARPADANHLTDQTCSPGAGVADRLQLSGARVSVTDEGELCGDCGLNMHASCCELLTPFSVWHT